VSKDPSKRVVISGMAVNHPSGGQARDVLPEPARRKVGHHPLEVSRYQPIHSKVGGDLSQYDVTGKLGALGERLPRGFFTSGSAAW